MYNYILKNEKQLKRAKCFRIYWKRNKFSLIILFRGRHVHLQPLFIISFISSIGFFFFFIYLLRFFNYFILFSLIVQKRGRSVRIKIFLANAFSFFWNLFYVLETLIMSVPIENDKTSSYKKWFFFWFIWKRIALLNCFSFFKMSFYIHINIDIYAWHVILHETLTLSYLYTYIIKFILWYCCFRYTWHSLCKLIKICIERKTEHNGKTK